MSNPAPADSSTAQPVTFHHNSPRPPVVPGEETCAGYQSPAVLWGGKLCRGGSPVPTPRRSTLSHHTPGTLPEGCAPLGFEPEGSSSPTPGVEGVSPPCLRWARCLPALLQDPDGVELFRSFLEAEGRAHADTLDFWFACEGLRKQTDPEKITQLVRVIYRRYFLKTQLGVGEELRRAVHLRIKEGSSSLDCRVFADAQQEIERIITNTTYPNFLHSDIYLGHVQAMQNGSSSPSNSGSGSGSGSSGGGCVVGSGAPLATVHEDAELTETPHSPLPLTRDMLLVTQKRRATELRPKPEAYAGVYLQSQSHVVRPARLSYSSYNPVSRQDSELQSLSSDARTESDNLSLTDTDLESVSQQRSSRKQYQRHHRQMREAATLNRDLHLHHAVIPRTQRIQKEQVHPMKPDKFAAILTEKLENVRRNQEAQEKLDRKLLEAEVLPADCSAAFQRSLSETIREKLQLEDDNDQDILDQHVSRVWSDLTPARSPGLASPRPKSPPHAHSHRRPSSTLNKQMGSSGSSLPSHVSMGPPHPYQSRPYPRYPRKDKDVFSTFSSDSGNVHDFTEGSEHRLHLPKSKSMPDYSDAIPGHESRLRQSKGRWSSKKTELTDSGVSVVSDTPPVSLASQFKDSRVLSWLMESGPGSGAGTVAGEGRSESVSSCGHRRRPASPPAPAQPFVADPSMPPLPSPHTATQLEEARRRLLEDEQRSKQNRSRFGVSGSQSGGSTLRRSGGRAPTTTTTNTTTTATSTAVPPQWHTTVVFSFCDEQFPYRTKIPGKQVTLRQFKEYVPKKGSYRYFFKTECEDLDMKVIQEEITDDNEILPLWEGKIMAQVKSAD